MKRSTLAALIACTWIAACAGQPIKPDQPQAQPAPEAVQPPPKAAEKPAVEKPVERPASLPAHELTRDILFKVMLAEVAVQRGQPQVAVSAYLDVARQTQDPRIAQRATEIAWNARMIPAALEAAGIWLKADPGSQRARQVLAALLLNQAKVAEALPHLENWLAADPSHVGQNFLQIYSLLARNPDRKTVLEALQKLAARYPEVPEARLVVAQAAWNADESELSLAEAQAALALRPDWEVAALFQAQVLQRRSNGEALAYLAGYLERNPKAKDARLNYARLLVAERNYPEARKQFEVLLKDFPQNADVTVAVALLAMQARDYDAAESHLKRALSLGYKDPDSVRLYLGQVEEERKRFDAALQWYASVEPGEQYINAQTRYASVLAKQGRLEEARAHLRQVNARTSQQRIQLTQAEASILREAMAYQEAFDLLSRALESSPDNPDLLYDHAMAAEKVNRIDVLESNLRKLIKLRPDHAHAYNALGYTFADRNERLDEARELIETALKLAPDDPFILDSMGWVLYRLGRVEEALGYLHRAYALRPDPEIAAHLGELLWIEGKREEAEKIWTDMLREHPKNEVLQNTIKRFLRPSHPAAR